jgi:hypothetical protein
MVKEGLVEFEIKNVTPFKPQRVSDPELSYLAFIGQRV